MSPIAPVGIVAALSAEARSCAAWQRAAGARLAFSGPGYERARVAASRLVDEGVSCLVSWGTSGALAADLAAGQLLLLSATSVVGGTKYASDTALLGKASDQLAALRPRVVNALTVLQPSVEPGAKLALGADGCQAVDMESAAVAAVAAQAGLPFLGIRAVVDPLSFAIPAAALAGMGEDGKSHPLRTVAALLRQPGELPALLHLARHYGSALNTLAKAAKLLGTTSTQPACVGAISR